MNFKKVIFGMILVLSFFVVGQNAFAASYSIDAIFDNENTSNYLTTDPTFKTGHTYNVTIQGSGSSPIGITDDDVRLGLFLDLENVNTIVDWAFHPDPPEFSDVTLGTGDGFARSYELIGSIMIPNTTPVGQGSGLAFLKIINIFDPVNGIQGLISADIALFNLNVVAPEPSTFALIGLGLAGAAFAGRRKFFKTA